MKAIPHPTAPHLAALRSAARSLGLRDLDAARFGLWAALERGDSHDATAWLSAVEVAVRAADPAAVDERLRALLLAAVEAIRAHLDAEVES